MSSSDHAWPLKRNARPISAALIAAALITWIVTVLRMRGMDGGPGTALGGLGWFLGVWVTMMAAMMLPSAAPMVLMFDRMSTERRRREQRFVPTWVTDPNPTMPADKTGAMTP